MEEREVGGEVGAIEAVFHAFVVVVRVVVAFGLPSGPVGLKV